MDLIRRLIIGILLLLTSFLVIPRSFAAGGADYPPLDYEKLLAIDAVAERAVLQGNTPGAVILVAQGDRVIYRKAFGLRSITPEKVAMEEEAVFDIASLTKVITATGIMQLAEKGRLKLDAPVAAYWPEFRKKGKAKITIRQLLTHYSGLKPDLTLRPRWSGYRAALQRIAGEKPVHPPGSGFIYSDINFEVLGEIVSRVSGLTLDRYCGRHIFGPLGMKDTGFRPAGDRWGRIAPTVYPRGTPLFGSVHDPWCLKMGGVAGHAGLFSTADDLARFARMILNGGELDGIRIMKSESVRQMTTPQSPAGKEKLRGLGWDLYPTFAADAQAWFPYSAFGHLGYTGTALWIDPVTGISIVLLTNRVHPDGKGDVTSLRREVKEAVSAALAPFERGAGPVLRTGIDVLQGESFAALAGLRVGLITNHTGIDSMGRSTLDLMYRAPGVRLVAVFSPEHGLEGAADASVPSRTDTRTGLPVHSLYGKVKRPTPRMLEGIDALVFDIQDAGARFYTYISTMGYAMEEAARRGIPFYVLDRPNPINCEDVQGPVPDPAGRSFTCYFPVPIRHGMTVGELAAMFNTEYRIGAKLNVIRMSGYHRADWFDETGLKWVNPSPNLRSLTGASLYPGVALVEGANVSVGRGTPFPFELIGAPWIGPERLARYLSDRNIPGVHFAPVQFTPVDYIYKGRPCGGVRISITDRQSLDSPYLGLEIISAFYRLYPRDFQLGSTLGMVGARGTLEAVRAGKDPREIAASWEKDLQEFRNIRAKYLLY